jgi:heptosyltransferase-2
MADHSPSSIFHPRRILVRGTNWLGDAVMTTPALLRLREKFPGTHIGLLCPEKLRELWLNHPVVDETISFAAGEGVFSIGKKLRSGKFDLALVLPNSPRSALEVFLAGIPQRIGYARPWRNFFLTQAIAPRADAVKMRKRSESEIRQLISENSKFKIQNSKYSQTAHQIHEYLHLAAALGANPEPLAPQLTVTTEEIETAKEKFGLENLKHTGGTRVPRFGLNPGAEYGPAKRWPVEKFIAAAKEIQRQTNCGWILFGGKNDTAITNQITSQLPTSRSQLLNLAGKTSLRELMALLKLCRVLLTNDTGPMHVAAALGTPVVVPFGSTSPELTGPGLPGNTRNRLLKSDAPCSPCFLRECPIDFRCMNDISVERVVKAVLQSIL